VFIQYLWPISPISPMKCFYRPPYASCGFAVHRRSEMLTHKCNTAFSIHNIKANYSCKQTTLPDIDNLIPKTTNNKTSTNFTQFHKP